jgi:glyoxylase-like metal-dependent hydrolase (beta-lactamase superfamily II)
MTTPQTATGLGTAPPAGFRLRVGDATLRRVEEIRFRFPLSSLGISEERISANEDWLFPLFADERERTWEMVVQSWVILVDGRIVVVDPCVGNHRHLPGFALFDGLDTPYLERFEATGIRLEDVDYVFCTHLHSDHCGWNTRLRDGRFVPTFPNARYVVTRREYDRWNPVRPGYKGVSENDGVFEASVLPVLEAGKLDLVADQHTLSSSLVVEPCHGHTAGHSLLHLISGGCEAYFTGDAFIHPLELLYPSEDRGNCEDFATMLATRQRLIARFLETDALIVPAHFAAPHAGHLRKIADRVVFAPARSD